MTQPVTQIPNDDNTSLASANYESTAILNQAFDLLGGMLNTVQSAAVAQAQSLTFFSNWQQIYTQQMATVPTFVSGQSNNIGGAVASSGTDVDSAERDSLNSINTNLIQIMQNRQTLVANYTKSMQTNVTQTNDAANQQATLATGLLQEISTLLPIVMGR